MSLENKSFLNSPIYEQAAEWLIELREGEVDASTCERLDAWFRESPQHIRAYLELSAVWEDGANTDLDRRNTTEELIALARSSSNVVPLKGETLAGGDAHRVPTCKVDLSAPNEPETLTSKAPPATNDHSHARKSRWRPASVAALAIACITGGGLYVYNQRNLTFASGIGEQRFVKLVDGSTLELNSGSRVQIRFSHAQRDVDLIEGQALFHVAKDSTRPFIVHSDTTQVRAVGTQFDVYRKSSGTVITVVEGRVAVLSPLLTQRSLNNSVPSETHPTGDQNTFPAVKPLKRTQHQYSTAGGGSRNIRASATLPEPALLSNATDAVFLDAGEQVTVGSQAPIYATHADTSLAIAWTQHELVFDSTPLSEVAREFNRYNTRKLTIAETSLRDIRITGVFSSADSNSLLKFLRSQPDIAVQETDEAIRIVKK